MRATLHAELDVISLRCSEGRGKCKWEWELKAGNLSTTRIPQTI